MYCIYLRKSRKDEEAEAHGLGETLLRHEEMLLALSKKLNRPIGRIYREIASGESIAARPVMQELLRDVESGMWQGVLVVEIERLARGNTKDQGIVAEAFSLSGTLIITPLKIYDPRNEFDEEYFEFGLFMSRREYKAINRRIQRGREASVKEGKWIYSDAPYGYRRVKLVNEKGWTLEEDPIEGPVVRLIYSLYTSELLGSTAIKDRLITMGITPRKSDQWHPASIRDILKNPVYAGYIKKGERVERLIVEDGERKKRRVFNPNHLIVRGIHTPLISEETFRRAEEIRCGRIVTSNSGEKWELRNPLAGIVECGICGRKMQYIGDRGARKQRIHCGMCTNISASFFDVEKAVLDGLAGWLDAFRLSVAAFDSTSEIAILQKSLESLETELSTISTQINRVYDYFEQGVYSPETFFERNAALDSRRASVSEKCAELKTKIAAESTRESKESFIPKVEHVLETYPFLTSAEQKNRLLKTVLSKVVYTRTEKGRGTEKSFSIEIFPLIDELL